MRWNFVLVLVAFLQLGFVSSAQKVNITKTNAAIKEVFNEIRQQTGYTFVYMTDLINPNAVVSIDVKDATLEEVISKCLEDQGVSFVIKNKTIILNASADPNRARGAGTQTQINRVTGKVVDDSGLGVASVSILVKGTTLGTRSDSDGKFTLALPDNKDVVLQVSSLGYKTREVTAKASTRELTIVLESAIEQIGDAVVTGIYTRSKESFTGSSATFSAAELKMVGNQNVLQSLRTLDPSFAIIENNEFGSDPNTLPDINIRGKTSVIGLSQEYENDPNQPLFILDGYETSLRVINDLNIDRVASITVLKDAAATAIYGSKSANGVVIVETKRPEAGTFKVSYNLNSSVNFADLSGYNLMSAEEKLLFERLSGYYGAVDANGDIILESSESVKYNNRLAEARRGVDTYWLNEPLRTAITQSHNIYADGGDQRMRYGIGFTFGKTPGVMKESDRNAINGNLRLIYRAGNFSFSNNLTIDHSEALREPVPFSNYSSTNPYFRKYDEFGAVSRVLETYISDSWASNNYGSEVKVFNPMYNASLNYIDRSPNFGFSNNLDVDWRAYSALRLRGRFSINKSTSKNERFVGPSNSQFDGVTTNERGVYNASATDALRYNGDLTATFGKLFAERHMLNIVAGIRLDHTGQITNGFSVRGFVDDNYPNPAFSNGYATGSRPQYAETERRSASYYSNLGYSYDNRFLIDGNFRSDGSSLFGVENQFTTTWAAGLAWNIHNEKFMSAMPYITFLKIRASVGNPGNQNFDARMIMNIYNYSLSYPNPFGLSALVNAWGNQGLDWQKTVDKNLGIDIEFMNRRLRLNVDLFDKNTDPLLVFVDVPTSTGMSTIPKNMGSQRTRGITGTLNWQILRTQNSMWSMNGNIRSLSMTYNDFGSALDRYNTENRSRSLMRYYDGGSPTNMWAVRSAGIDPATGREIFITKEGTQTFVHDYADEVIVGNTSPKFEGVVGTSYYYRGFNVSVNFRYKVGGQVQLSSLFNKVENISRTSLAGNQDRRALYDRWQKPGDVAKYKGISLTDQTPMSDRFVADENVLSAESISAGYNFESPRLVAWGISGLNVRGYMSQIFRVSTVKEERGISYPFARSVSFSVGARF